MATIKASVHLTSMDSTWTEEWFLMGKLRGISALVYPTWEIPVTQSTSEKISWYEKLKTLKKEVFRHQFFR